MQIKVQCPCGSRFEFEVEPVNGSMPVTLACPTCGADATMFANVVIQQQSSSASAAPSSGLRTVTSQTSQASSPHTEETSEVAQSESGATPCPKHKSETAVDVCCVCGKRICLKCMELFGYVCSVYCRQQAIQKRIYVPVYALQKSIVSGKSHRRTKLMTAAGAAMVVLLLCFWIGYAWFARTPQIVYQRSIPKPELNSDRASQPNEFYELIAPAELLSIKAAQLALFDLRKQSQIWSASLPTGGEATSDSYFANSTVLAGSNDIWVASPNRLARFDRQTGASKETGIQGETLQVSESSGSLLVISQKANGPAMLTQISLPAGDSKTEEIIGARQNASGSSSTPAGKRTPENVISEGATGKFPIGKFKTLVARANSQSAPADEPPSFSATDEMPAFIAAGPDVVQFRIDMLERKTVSHVAMKPKSKSVLDGDNLTASQGLDVAEEMMNDSRREMTGGAEQEDVSRYRITLHRLFAGDVPDWTGEIIGPPQFFPLHTVDVLTAGRSIYVFDKKNKKLWDAKLTFPAASRRFNNQPPCLETSDALYFADLGMLTSYDLATGNVQWRYNSVGISQVQIDARGAIYLDTTTADPESIQYSQQINIKDKIRPVLMKLAPDTGKVLWLQESLGDHALLSGKFLYATKISTALAALRLEEGPDTHYALKLLDPLTGNEIWRFHRVNQRIIKTTVQKNWILLQFADEVMVLKFFSL